LTVHTKPEKGPDPTQDRPEVLGCSALLDKMAGEVDRLRQTLGQVERAMCDMIDDKGIPIDGEVATSLQQLDLAVQTTGVLTDIMRRAASDTTCAGYPLEGLLQSVTLRDVAERIRG